MSTSYGKFRISDAERSDAMTALGRALGEGRITMDEFDRRCTAVAEAQFHEDLTRLFEDLPQVPARVGPSSEVALYGADEIRASRRRGQRTRAGIFWLGTLGAVGATIALSTVSELGALALFVVPTLYILLYVMKVGPDSWYTPSLRQLEKRRRELIRVQQLEIEASRAREIAEQRVQRREQVNQLTTDAINVAQSTVNRFKRRR
ncbi:DUF1707 SHOCT-like domain-containing protein [Corynebacterium sp. UBA2622]|uniref:DUF1707 SHOCT-like domain-containing protein n=1 Tax=Corynebacterium sp. UBA2622 TaxID=1946393 RepID=UPI0025BED140|nr:DUF1707 domain-containing protein [Corynebacterium sp. UBA2622]